MTKGIKRYPVIYENPQTDGAPIFPICLVAWRSVFTLDETKRLIRKSLEIHLRSMREDGDPIPEPSHVVDVLEVA
jgi:hypothetical protein